MNLSYYSSTTNQTHQNAAAILLVRSLIETIDIDIENNNNNNENDLTSLSSRRISSSCVGQIGRVRRSMTTRNNNNSSYSIFNETYELDIDYLLVLNYLFIVPSFSAIGLLINLVNVAVFGRTIRSSLTAGTVGVGGGGSSTFYQLLMANSLFNLLACLISLVYPLIVLFTDLNVIGSRFGTFVELYFLNFALNVLLLLSILMLIGTTFERYIEMNKYKIDSTRFMQRNAFKFILVLCILASVSLHLLMLFQYEITDDVKIRMQQDYKRLFDDSLLEKNDRLKYVRYHSTLIKEKLKCNIMLNNVNTNTSSPSSLIASASTSFSIITMTSRVNKSIYNYYVLALVLFEDLFLSTFMTFLMMGIVAASLRRRFSKKKKYFVAALIRRNLFQMSFILNLSSNNLNNSTINNQLLQQQQQPQSSQEESFQIQEQQQQQQQHQQQHNKHRIELMATAATAAINAKDYIDEHNLKRNATLMYKKSAQDIVREKLIEIVVAVNMTLLISKLPSLFSLALEKLEWLFWTNSVINMEDKLNYIKLSIICLIVSDACVYLSYCLNIIFYFKFDERYQREFECLFKHICYFQINCPKKIKVTLYG